MQPFITINITTSPYGDHTVIIRGRHTHFAIAIAAGELPDMPAIMSRMRPIHLHAFLRELSMVDNTLLANWLCVRPDWYTYGLHIDYCGHHNEPTFLQMAQFDRDLAACPATALIIAGTATVHQWA